MSEARLWRRRDWLLSCGAGSLGGLLFGCSARDGAWTTRLRPSARALLRSGPRPLPIVQWRLGRPNRGSVLRRAADPASGLARADLSRLDTLMRQTLKQSGGVGLAAPQVGVSRRVVLVQLQNRKRDVITCVDPRIVGSSRDLVSGYEACLSVRGVGGLVQRVQWVEVAYVDDLGRPRRHRATGWEARIFQHELDHLEGRLYVDLVAGPLLPIDEMRRRRRKRRTGDLARRPWVAAVDAPEELWL